MVKAEERERGHLEFECRDNMRSRRQDSLIFSSLQQ